MSFSVPVLSKGPKTSFETEPERALLVGIDRKDPNWPLSESLAELERLVDTAGALCVGWTSQRLDKPNPAYFIGSGKAEEVAQLCLELKVDVVVFDDELSPTQQSNLEKVVPKSVKVIDRTALILDIFSLHATSKEGRLQVRLAQNEYLYPRLRGMWAHLASNRMGGGVGSRFGEGESQLEVDRRMVRKRITSIKRELKELQENRQLQRKSRLDSGIFRIALAGYTNAGKSSLLNYLTNAEVLSYDKLFATLDSTTRKLQLPEGRQVTITDTVGFIQKLPHNLVNAFQSTLDEVTSAHLILHTIDASSENLHAQMIAVDEVFDQINANEIAKVLVFNKCDLLDEGQIRNLKERFPAALCVSSKTGRGIDDLLERISFCAAANDALLNLRIPYDKGGLLARINKETTVITSRYEDDAAYLLAQVPQSLASQIKPYVVNSKDEPQEL